MRCAKAAMKIMKKFQTFTVPTLMRHLAQFGKEIAGKKVNGKRRTSINVQPSALARSRQNGTKRRGRKAIGITRPHKDRSGQQAEFVLENGETIVLPSLGKANKKSTAQPHNLQLAVDQQKAPLRRHRKQ